MFFVVSSIKLGQFSWNLVGLRMVSWINLSKNQVNVSHLTWVMSLHYLVKLKMFMAHVLPLSCQRKKLQTLFHLNCGLQIRQIWIQLISECGEYCKRRCTKYASLIWNNWNSDWERSRPSWITSSLWQPFVSGVVDGSRSVMRVLHTCSRSNPHTL